MESRRAITVPLFGFPLPELCMFRQVFGTDCPGCGMTRSFVLASRLRLVEAWNMNPAGCMLFISLMVSAPFRFVQWIRAKQGMTMRSTLAPEAGWLVVVASVMMFGWMYRTFS
jgi:hypothetical protein